MLPFPSSIISGFNANTDHTKIYILMSKILLLACLVAVSLANLQLNIRYRAFVNGETLYSEAVAR